MHASSAALLSLLLLVSTHACSDSPAATCTPDTAPAGRLRPPETLGCPRDHLTSFSGCVTGYTHTDLQTELRLRTDEDTDERFLVRHPHGDLESWLLIDALRFQKRDWARIERAPGVLRDNLRVIVWVCDDGTNPVIDWRPVAD